MIRCDQKLMGSVEDLSRIMHPRFSFRMCMESHVCEQRGFFGTSESVRKHISSASGETKTYLLFETLNAHRMRRDRHARMALADQHHVRVIAESLLISQFSERGNKLQVSSVVFGTAAIIQLYVHTASVFGPLINATLPHSRLMSSRLTAISEAVIDEAIDAFMQP